MTTPEEEIKRLLLSPELDLLERLRDRTDHLTTRVGDDAAFRESARAVIVDVLRDAGVRDHDRLARVMAPLVVSSMRDEIRNSRDMMVDALYPITGRLVAAAVRNAFRDLMENLNEKLDQSFSFARWKIRLQARATGRSEAELLLQRNPPFEIEDLLVIHRPTGLLIARAQAAGGRDGMEGHEELDSDLLGGMLTAIMSFVRDAMGETEGGALQRLEFGGSALFLRSSPAVILAVKAAGTKPSGFDATLEAIFQSFLVRWGDTLRGFDGAADEEDERAILDDLRERLATLLAAKKQNFRRRSRKAPLALLAILLLLVGWGGYEWFQNWRVAGLEQRADAVLAAEPELAGFPIDARYDWASETLLIEGLFPDQAALDKVQQKVAEAVPESPVAFVANLVSRGETEELSKQLGQLREGLGGLERSLDVAITTVQPQLERLGEQTSALESATGKLEDSIGDTASSASERADEIGRRIESLGSETQQLEGTLSNAIGTIADQAVEVGKRTEMLEQVTSRLDQALAETARSADSRAEVLSQQIAEFRDVTAQLEQSVTQLGTSAEAQRSELAGRMRGLEALSRRLDTAIGETKSTAEGGLEATNARSSDLEAAVRQLETRVAEAIGLIETQGETMATRTQDLKSATGRLKSSLQSAVEAAGLNDSQFEEAGLRPRGRHRQHPTRPGSAVERSGVGGAGG